MTHRRRPRQLAARIRRGLVVALALAAYLGSTVGFPLPNSHAKDTSRPFPCQGHACGCQNAEQCWSHCCCYTAEEKVAWARAHHVEPPADVVTEAEKGWDSPRLRDREESKQGGEEKCCCSCCKKKEPKPAPAVEPKKQTTWIIGLSALGCQGQGKSWLSNTATFPPPPLLWWHFEWTPVCWLTQADAVSVTLSHSPPAPPPRG
jgi:hypothetical protein